LFHESPELLRILTSSPSKARQASFAADALKMKITSCPGFKILNLFLTISRDLLFNKLRSVDFLETRRETTKPKRFWAKPFRQIRKETGPPRTSFPRLRTLVVTNPPDSLNFLASTLSLL